MPSYFSFEVGISKLAYEVTVWFYIKFLQCFILYIIAQHVKRVSTRDPRIGYANLDTWEEEDTYDDISLVMR